MYNTWYVVFTSHHRRDICRNRYFIRTYSAPHISFGVLCLQIRLFATRLVIPCVCARVLRGLVCPPFLLTRTSTAHSPIQHLPKPRPCISYVSPHKARLYNTWYVVFTSHHRRDICRNRYFIRTYSAPHISFGVLCLQIRLFATRLVIPCVCARVLRGLVCPPFLFFLVIERYGLLP